MPRIRFTADCGNAAGRGFVDGEILTCDFATAIKWIRRGVAEMLPDDQPPQATTAGAKEGGQPAAKRPRKRG